MKYKHLNKANVDISYLTVGTWAIGGDNYGAVNREDSIKAIRAMIDNGVNVVDTAPDYGNGYSEQLVGEALQDGYREKVYLATKVGIIKNFIGPDCRDNSFKNIMREIASSLFNLKTDHIDFYFIHWPDKKTPIAETMSALMLLKRLGMIKNIGVSNFSVEQIEEALKYGDVDVNQCPYSMVDQSAKELMEWCEARGIDNFTYGSLGSGILTGAIREKPNFDKDDYRLTFYDVYKEPKFSNIQKLLKVMDGIAEKHNVPVAQVAINWSLSQSIVGTALVGVRNVEQAVENCNAFNWELSKEEINILDNEMKELGLSR